MEQFFTKLYNFEYRRCYSLLYL